MAFHDIWTTAKPALRTHPRSGADARVAVHSAAWPAVGRMLAAALRWLARRIKRTSRRRWNYAELSSLSDHTLRDIGLSRTDIISASRVAADEATGLTVAEFRRWEAREALRAAAADHVLLPSDHRPRPPRTRTVVRLELVEGGNPQRADSPPPGNSGRRDQGQPSGGQTDVTERPAALRPSALGTRGEARRGGARLRDPGRQQARSHRERDQPPR